MRALISSFFILAILGSGNVSAQVAPPNLYKNVFMSEVGPELMRNQRWAELILMEATNEYFKSNPRASINEYKNKFGPALKYVEQKPDVKGDLAFGVNLMYDFVPKLPVPVVNSVLRKLVDRIIDDQAGAVNRAMTIDFPRVGVFRAGDIIAESEKCVGSTVGCRRAYDEILRVSKLGQDVESTANAFRLKLRSTQDREGLADDVLRLKVKIDERQRRTRTRDIKPEEADALARLNAKYIEDLTQNLEDYRIKIEDLQNERAAQAALVRHQQQIADLRAGNFLFTTALSFIDPVVAQKTAKVAEGFTQIVDVLGRADLDLSKLVVAASLTQGALLIGEALFGGGASSFEQATVAALQEIQKQISQLRAEMHRGFQGLNWKLDQIYERLADSISQVHGVGVDLQRSVGSVQMQLRDLSSKIDQARLDNADSFRVLQRIQLSGYAACFEGAPIDAAYFTNCRSVLREMVTNSSGGSLYVSIVDPSLDNPSLSEVSRPTPELGGYLLRYGTKALGSEERSIWFPHLAVWLKYAATYLEVLGKYPRHVNRQSNAIRGDLQEMYNSGVKVEEELGRIGNSAVDLFRVLQENYSEAAKSFVNEVRRNYVRGVNHSNEDGSRLFEPLSGQQYFADHLEGPQVVKASYDLFGSADQVRPGFRVAGGQPLHLCPDPSIPRGTNAQFFPLTLPQIVAYPRAFLTLYGPGQVESGTAPSLPNGLESRVPGIVKMFADLKGREIGFCISDVNWLIDDPFDCRIIDPLLRLGAGVNLKVTINAFVKTGNQEYDQSTVFEQITLDSRGTFSQDPFQRTLWRFNDWNTCREGGDHVIHRMHNFLYGTDSKPSPMGLMLARIGTPAATHVPNNENIQSMQREVEGELKERRYYFASALHDLLVTGQSNYASFEGSNYPEIKRKFEAVKIAYLLQDRFLSLLVNGSYSRDTGGIYESVGLLDTDGYIKLLLAVRTGYVCDSTREDPQAPKCSVRAENTTGVPVNFVEGFPLLVDIKELAGVTEGIPSNSRDQLFRYEKARSLSIEAGKKITAQLEANKAKNGVYFETVPPFKIVKDAIARTLSSSGGPN